ncbi:MAG: tRNA 2-thiouridine(34) synthase MnmA [Patescibacteria group bacterium]
MKKNKEKILVALSGGVDSAVAAALLVARGFDVTGAFMVNYEADERENGKPWSKCWTADYRDALRVAAGLGVPLIRLDFTKEYKKYVLDYLYREYELGNTPNPDVLCNQYIKFGFWLKKAKQLGFSKLATGHYARTNKITNYELRITNCETVSLLEAMDKNKDQTYFLHQLGQDQLRDVLFPIGEYTKPQVRKLAKKFGLPVAEKEESMGICFVGEVPMKEFLESKVKTKPGKVILSSGEVIGEHDGLAFYTIGQRHLGINNYPPSPIGASDGRGKLIINNYRDKPLYVVGKKMDANELIVGNENDPLLYKKTIRVIDVNWISGQEPKFPLKCLVRLRHRQPLQTGSISKPEENKTPSDNGLIIKFNRSQRAPATGQFAVFYRDEKCLGGGIISG